MLQLDDPQSILKHLIENEKLTSFRPEDIIKQINLAKRPEESELAQENNLHFDLIGSHDYDLRRKEIKNLEKEWEKATPQEKEYLEYIEEVENDITSPNYEEKIIASTKLAPTIDDIEVDDINLYKILDSLVSDDNELFDIEFNSDQENIFEVEELTKEHIENINIFNTNIVEEKDVPQKIRDQEKKKGSVKQRTVNLKSIFQTGILKFQDEGDELFLVLKSKLLIYWDIILDFEDIVCTEVFLRSGIGQLCKYLSPNEIIERIDFINIHSKNYSDLLKEILPNSYKYWSSQKDVNLLEQDLIHTLDESTKVVLEDQKLVSDEIIPFERLKAGLFNRRKEKKLRYPIYFVERVIKDLIEAYNIDEKMTAYMNVLIIDSINWDEVKENNLISELDYNKYKFQISGEVFPQVFGYCQSLLLDSCYNYLEDIKKRIKNFKKEIDELSKKLPKNFLNKFGGCFQMIFLEEETIDKLPEKVRYTLRRLEELEFALMDEEHKFFIKQDILRNIFEYIPFNIYKSSLDKVKLITYHYIVKHLEDTIYLKIEEDSNFFPTLLTRGSPNKLEMFRFDVIRLLQSDKVLERFVFTLREIVTRWVNEYNKIFSFSKYFYDTYMITPDIFTDKIVKALLFGALKKKNPMTLRATFSTYLSMIHLIIYKEMNSDFLKRRVGSFTREDDLATNANRQSQRYFQVKDTSRSFSSKLLKNILEDNPKLLNENYYLFKRLDLGFMLENDSLEMLASRPKEIPVHDWIFYWYNCFRHFDEPNYKIKKSFLNNRKTVVWQGPLRYIQSLCEEKLSPKIFNIVKDYDSVYKIVECIAEDIAKRTANNGYLDKNFNIIVKSNTNYIEEITRQIERIAENL